MCFEFLLGISRLVNSSGEDDVSFFLLASHVITGRLQHAVHYYTQRRRVLALLVRFRDVPVGKVFPLVRSRRSVT